MIAIFSIAKPFVGHIAIIQRNAIRSWLTSCPDAEIVLFGDALGTRQTCAEFGIRFGGSVQRSEFGRDLVSDAFTRVQESCSHETLAYINCDIILLDDFKSPLSILERAGIRRYLLSARRHCLDVGKEIELFDATTRHDLRADVIKRGRLDGPSALDCFLFQRGGVQNMPPFGVGEIAWDNWMIHDARSRGIPVIDATPGFTLVHQNHAPLSLGPVSPDGNRNIQLAGGLDKLGTLREADWVLEGSGLRGPSLSGKCYRLLQDTLLLRFMLQAKRRARLTLRARWARLPGRDGGR